MLRSQTVVKGVQSPRGARQVRRARHGLFRSHRKAPMGRAHGGSMCWMTQTRRNMPHLVWMSSCYHAGGVAPETGWLNQMVSYYSHKEAAGVMRWPPASASMHPSQSGLNRRSLCGALAGCERVRQAARFQGVSQHRLSYAVAVAWADSGCSSPPLRHPCNPDQYTHPPRNNGCQHAR